jgi:hypothetical protein
MQIAALQRSRSNLKSMGKISQPAMNSQNGEKAPLPSRKADGKVVPLEVHAALKGAHTEMHEAHAALSNEVVQLRWENQHRQPTQQLQEEHAALMGSHKDVVAAHGTLTKEVIELRKENQMLRISKAAASPESIRLVGAHASPGSPTEGRTGRSLLRHSSIRQSSPRLAGSLGALTNAHRDFETVKRAEWCIVCDNSGLGSEPDEQTVAKLIRRLLAIGGGVIK